MTFSTTITVKTVWGNKRVHYGIVSQQSGDEGGVVKTGLRKIESFDIWAGGKAIHEQAPTVNATFPIVPGDASGIVVILGSGVSTAYWLAVGTV